MLISSTIPNLINGISQQPPTLRLSSQAETQVNFISSVADGLQRRPGTRHRAQIASVPLDEAFLHTINRDSSERYLVSIRAGAIQVFDAQTGAPQVVNTPDGLGYISGATDRNTFRAVTVADFTFILNRSITADLSAALTPPRVNQAIISVRAGNYGKKYRVFINGALRGGYDTPTGANAADIEAVRTTKIVEQLVGTLNGTLPMPAGTTQGILVPTFTYSVVADAVVITAVGPDPFTVTVLDDTGGSAIIAVVSKTQRFADLPRVAPEGFSVEITGDATSSFDNYHVSFETQGSSGVWNESAKGGEKFRFDPATMPHSLVREEDGTFTFRRSVWVDRKVGDMDSLPPPSFVGRKINDIFFFRDRLGVLSDENVILTKQGEFFDFFRDTATTTLDTDPLDLAVSNTKVSILNHALPFNESLLLFSDSAQFILQSGEILTADTAYITQATEFESTAGVRPVGVGPFVYFPVPRGNFTGLREYFVEVGNEQNNALDITAHCPRYLPKNLFKLTASSAEDILFGISSDAPETLWVYKFYFSSDGKLQSSWSRWDFEDGCRILSAEFIQSKLFLIMARDDGTAIESMDIESGALDQDASVHYHTDRGLFLSGGSFDGTFTTFTLPYSTTTPLWVLVGGEDGVYPEGFTPEFTAPTTSTVRLQGDWTGRKLFAGIKFKSSYRFSTLFLRDQSAGGSQVALDDGRLQIRRMAVNYARSGYFRVVVQARDRLASIREFTGRVLGDVSATIGAFGLSEGRFGFPVLSRNRQVTIDIESDHFLPCSFTSAEFEATYDTISRRV